MKLYERPKTKKTLDRLPEMPEGVVVPDDISGLQPPTALKATAGAYRWMRWLAAIIVLGAAGVLGAVLFTGGDNATEIAQVEVLGSDRHLAAMAGLTADPVAPTYMELYGTDNPVFVTAPVPELGSDRHLATMAGLTADPVAPTYMELYGTDNPVFVTAPVPELGSDRHLATMAELAADRQAPTYMELYGTDNPVFVEPAPETMANPTEGPGSTSLAP